jgi:hypothetical protein
MYLSNPASDQALQLAALLVRQVTVGEIDAAIARIHTAIGFGPLIHPSAWMKSNAFKGSDLAIRSLEAMKTLRQVLAEADRELHGVENILEEKAEAPGLPTLR